MPHIIPIKALKNASEVSELCHQLQEPVYVTRNGYGDMVLMSMETFETQFHREQIYRELEIAEMQIQSGQRKNAKISLTELRNTYGV